MKKKLNNILKIKLLVFLALILGCDKEQTQEFEIRQEKKVKRISLDEFNSNLNFNDTYNELQSYFDANTLNASSQSNQFNRIDSDSEIVLLTDDIIFIHQNNIDFYTFKVITETDGNEFYNLIVQVNEHQEIVKSEFLEYIPSDNWLSDTSQPFTGQVRLIDNDFLNIDNLFSSRGSGLCVTGATGSWECNYNKPHAIGEGTDCSSWTYYIDLTYGACPPSDNGYSGTEYTIDAGDSGSGGGNGSSGGSSTIPTRPCDRGTNGITDENGNCVDLIEYQLNLALDDEPFLLLEIDCNQIQNWQTLAQHTAPQSVQNKINNLPSSLTNNFEIQSLSEANGTMVNLDYFSVSVTNLPNNPNTNTQFTADEFLDYIRRNFNDFVEGSTFEPYCEIASMCQTETDLWSSNNPLSSIIYIDIPLDDGVVVCTEYTNSYWYFMTMNAPYSGNHPVSGTRQFGYEQNLDGIYNFFVRGVDRFDSNIDENLAWATQFGNAF
tara:strand:- start:55 stop:1530 length:1476 start_codon:yes stop_codon:yes gene_type:complete